jgi:hypothetical protein
VKIFKIFGGVTSSSMVKFIVTAVRISNLASETYKFNVYFENVRDVNVVGTICISCILSGCDYPETPI